MAERAYVSGGCGKIELIRGGQNGVRITTKDNYGETPGLITGISVALCRINELPATPTYPTPIPINDWISPGTMGHQIRQAIVSWFDNEPRYFYGRIYFEDIFRQSHWFSFIHMMRTNGTHDIEDRPEYWEWS